MSQRYSSLDEVIKENGLAKGCMMSAEQIRHYAKMAMITNSLAYILADAAETFLLDCECALGMFDRHLQKKVKQNFKLMKQAVHSARQAAKKAAEPMYLAGGGFTDDACIDSDWWYNLVKLIDDRLGVDKQKTNLFLEFLLNMPSEGEGLFHPRIEDFVNE